MRSQWIVAVGLAWCLTATLAMAQPPGWGERDRGWGDRGRGDRGDRSFGPPSGWGDRGRGDRGYGPSGGGDQPQMSADEADQRRRRADFFISELDANHNGVIEAEEVTGGKRFYADRLLQRAGIEPNYPIALAKVREGIQRYYQGMTVPGGAGMMPGSPSGYYGGPGYRPPGYGPPGYGPPGFFPPGGGSSSANDPTGERRRQFEQAFAEFKHLDENNDGIVDEKETTGGTSHSHKEIFEKTMAKAGLPATPPARVETVRERLFAVIVNGASAASTYGGTSAVAGFGVAASAQAPVAGFGPVAVTQPVSTGRSSGGGSSPLPPPRNEEESRVQRYASSLLAQYDKNKNGVLEPDEWKEMKGDVKSADKNGDGKVTLEELTAWLQQFGRGGGGDRHARDESGGSSGKSGGSSSGSGSSASSGKGAIRFTTSAERLPSGLPDWFLQKDVNGDGQVAMAEYASDWSRTKIDEFYEYDSNRDGYVTPAEVLAADKTKAKAAKEGKSGDRKSSTESKDARSEPPKGPFGPPPASGWGRGPGFGFGPPPSAPATKEAGKEPNKETAKEPSKETAKEPSKEPAKEEAGKEPSKDSSKGSSKDSRDRRPGWGRR